MELPDLPQIARELAGRETRAEHEAPFFEAVAALEPAELRAPRRAVSRIDPRAIARPRRRSSSTRCPTIGCTSGCIHLILPNAKIIDARRHPLGCCFSAFKQHFARGQNFSYDLADLGRYYRDYVELMAHVDAVLPGRVHRVFYESMIEDTEAEVRRLLDYCGLPFEERCLQVLRERAGGAHREFRAGAPAHFPRGHGSLAALRALARAAETGAGRGAGALSGGAGFRRRSDDCSIRRSIKPKGAREHMTRSRSTTGAQRPNVAGRPRDHRQQVLRRLPLASAISAILAGGVPAAHAASRHRYHHARRSRGHGAEARREPAETCRSASRCSPARSSSSCNVGDLDDYVKYSPSISYSRAEGQGGNGQPGTSHIYMRGVVSGANENHSGSQPSVGTYFDEQPVTTIDGTPDIHLYDIQRIEVLEGPQGTLYGASSEAGTVRIITNKPDPTKFSASYDVQGNQIEQRRQRLEGRRPTSTYRSRRSRRSAWSAGTSTTAAISTTWRAPTRTPASSTACAPFRPGQVSRRHLVQSATLSSAGTAQSGRPTEFGERRRVSAGGAHRQGSISNAAYVANNYNTVDTQGWPRRAQIRHQRQLDRDAERHGPRDLTPRDSSATTPAVGNLQVTHFGPESSNDTFDCSRR